MTVQSRTQIVALVRTGPCEGYADQIGRVSFGLFSSVIVGTDAGADHA
jgi:hypothetical protein